MEKKKRKNRKPLIVVAMLLMVALVVGMGAMTYSRYVSSFNSGVQQATAAKWGFVVKADASKLFGDDYKGSGLAAVTDEASDLVVSATDDANIVAPGTTGYITIDITGSAEVLAQLTVTVNNATLKEIDYKGYNPVTWTLYNNDAPVAGAQNVTLATALSKLSGAEIPAGTTANYKYKLEWKWALGASDDNDTNIKDTVIGIKAANATYTEELGKTLLADGTTLKDQFTVGSEATEFAAIKTVLAFELSIKLEQIQ